MCLTSIPTAQFQNVDDFNIDEYDSEYIESADFGTDDAFFNDFIAGFMPPGVNAAEHFTSEMVAPVMEDVSAMKMAKPATNKRPASMMMASNAAPMPMMVPIQVKSEGHMVSALMSKGRRLKKRRRRAFTNDDPRRGYVDLIFCAINTGDGLLSLLQRITHPEVTMTARFLGDPSALLAGKLYRELKGREQIAKFMDTFLLASPDAVLRLHEKKMRLRQNNSSYVVAKYTLEGHKFCHLLTTNDKHVSKKALRPTKTVPAAAQTVQAVAAAGGVACPMTKASCASVSLSSTSHDESETSSAHSPSSLEDQWSEHLLDDFSGAESPFLLDDAFLAHAEALLPEEKTGELSCEDIAAKSAHMLQAWQFPQRPQTISGAEQKVSVASLNTDFGLSNSLPIPAFISSIGTMALHINASRQVYKIDFLWTFKKADDGKRNK